MQAFGVRLPDALLPPTAPRDLAERRRRRGPRISTPHTVSAKPAACLQASSSITTRMKIVSTEEFLKCLNDEFAAAAEKAGTLRVTSKRCKSSASRTTSPAASPWVYNYNANTLVTDEFVQILFLNSFAAVLPLLVLILRSSYEAIGTQGSERIARRRRGTIRIV